MIIKIVRPDLAIDYKQYTEYATQTYAFKTRRSHTKFRKFTPLSILARVLKIDTLTATRLFRSSSKYQLLMLDTGESFVHPDDFIDLLKKSIKILTKNSFI